jgi:cobalt ECF transporter T component CbiQ
MRPEPGLCPCGCIGRRRKAHFVEKTLDGAAGVMGQALFSTDVAAEPGVLQRVDPRVKVVTTLALLVATALVHHIGVLVAFYAVTLALAAASRVSLRFFVKRVWLFVPLFTGIVVIPATLSVVTPGHVVVPLGSWLGHPVGITSQGLRTAGLLVCRVAVSISLVVLLTLTTPWNRLLAALRALSVPRMFVLVLGMAYRYLFHLLNAVTDMYTARQARTVGRGVDVARGRVFVAASAGATFGKAHALSEEVHMAMVSRGFTGDIRTLDAARVTAFDWLWVAASASVVLLTLGADHVLR